MPLTPRFRRKHFSHHETITPHITFGFKRQVTWFMGLSHRDERSCTFVSNAKLLSTQHIQTDSWVYASQRASIYLCFRCEAECFSAMTIRSRTNPYLRITHAVGQTDIYRIKTIDTELNPICSFFHVLYIQCNQYNCAIFAQLFYRKIYTDDGSQVQCCENLSTIWARTSQQQPTGFTLIKLSGLEKIASNSIIKLKYACPTWILYN